MKPPIEISGTENICKTAGISFNETKKLVNLIRSSMEPMSRRVVVCDGNVKCCFTVERRGLGVLNTRFGKFWHYSFNIDDRWDRYSVIVKANIDSKSLNPTFKNKKRIILRTDSGCETGQIFGDVTCECREQLHLALETIAGVGEGMLINIPHQDGRGMGLAFKLATLWAQDALGVNTVESANLFAPGGLIDTRTYSGVIAILKFFGIPENCRINLATNNPKKAEIFFENGYKAVDYTPVVVEPNKHTEKHLRAKQRHLGHKGLIKKTRSK